MPAYNQIGSAVTVGAGGAASIDFTSIPATYTDLLICYSLRSNYANIQDRVKLIFNNTSSAIYNSKHIEGDGATAITGARVNQTFFFPSEASASTGTTATGSTFSNFAMYIPNYGNSSANKSFLIDGVMENNSTTAYMNLQSGLWASTAAINQISIVPYGGTAFLQYSTAYLYAISNA
jgi:hypothetical protein